LASGATAGAGAATGAGAAAGAGCANNIATGVSSGGGGIAARTKITASISNTA
jgi:hypothetical protein